MSTEIEICGKPLADHLERGITFEEKWYNRDIHRIVDCLVKGKGKTDENDNF